MKIWIYGKDKQDIERIKGRLDLSTNELIGASVKAGAESIFPDSGLISALSTAMRSEIDTLAISDDMLLGYSKSRRKEIKKLFESYRVSVKRVEVQ